jgi:hypothetical protein
MVLFIPAIADKDLEANATVRPDFKEVITSEAGAHPTGPESRERWLVFNFDRGGNCSGLRPIKIHLLIDPR